MPCRYHIIDSYEATPPAANLIQVLANSGYSIESSIADIIDNSITAHAKNIDINFVRKGVDSYVEILDDGSGMNDAELRSAMVYANHSIYDARSSDDLGRYGIGMKTASSAFCQRLNVISKSADGVTNAYQDWFLDKEWKTYRIQIGEEDRIPYKTGTRVIWEELVFSRDQNKNKSILENQRNSFTGIVARVAAHLSKVYGLLIEKGLTIRVNGSAIKGWNPFYVPDGDVTKIFSDASYVIGGQPIRVETYVLPIAERMNEQQLSYVTCKGLGRLTDFEGFYVYRHNRLIVPGGWLGIPRLNIGEKFNYARIGIWFEPSPEIDQYLRVDFLKNSIKVPPDFADYLYPIARDVRSKSANSYNYKKNQRPYQRISKDSTISVWNVTRKEHSLSFSVNLNHPLIQKYTEGMPKSRANALFNLLAKEFPFYELEEGAPKVQAYSDEELEEMLKEEFLQKTQEEHLSFWDAVAQILKTAPFNDPKYIDKCKSILASWQGGINNEQQ